MQGIDKQSRTAPFRAIINIIIIIIITTIFEQMPTVAKRICYDSRDFSTVTYKFNTMTSLSTSAQLQL